MRYFLMILAIMVASLGINQTASAQACTGFALLQDGDQYTDLGGGRALLDNRCYQRALCIGGTISNLGSNLYGCFVEPGCEGTKSLPLNGVAAKNADESWSVGGTTRVYCNVICPVGATLTKQAGNTYYCKAEAPACNGVGQLELGDKIWKRAANMWKTEDGRNTYCSVQCPAGSTLTHQSGDTHYCKPNAPVCNGVGQLKSGDEIWKRASNMWKTKDGSKTYCSVKCENGTTLTKTNGDTHVCKPNAPVCNGVGQLKSGDKIWKRAANMWKTRDGQNTYCSVKCESGTTLTHVKGDTHICKPNPLTCQQMSDRYGVSHFSTWGTATAAIKADWQAQKCATCKPGHVKDAEGKCGNPAPVCNGVGQLKSGGEIWKRASNMWKTKDGQNTYCSVKCENGTTLTHVKGDTHICKPNAPVCNGVGQLKSGDEIWKRASNMWKTKDGSKTYCSVKCENGTTLTKTNGDTHVCKPNAPVCNGVGQLKSGDKIWKRAANMWKTRDGQNTYCSVKCESGTTLTHVKGDTHICKPNPLTCQQMSDRYGVSHFSTWGTATAAIKTDWQAQKCATCKPGHVKDAEGKCGNPAPVCNGVGQLKSGGEIWKRASNMWKTKDGQNTYCSVKCESGTTLTHVKGDTHICKPNAPTCSGTKTLSKDGVATKGNDNFWRLAKGNSVYCDVKCATGKELTKISGNNYQCQTPAPVCSGTKTLSEDGVATKGNDNFWRLARGNSVYCDVKCATGKELTKISGSDYQCKTPAPTCRGVRLLKSGDEAWKRAANVWKTKDSDSTFCSVSCAVGSTLTKTSGDTHVCKPNPPVCNGVGQLKSGDEIWKRASNMWKTKDGSKTYCSVKCESGTTLTKTNGDTHVCKPNPLTCQQMSNRYGVSHKNTWGSATAAIKADWKAQSCTTCKSGHVKDATGKCGNPAPACNGVGQLKSGDQIWKRASNMWKTKDGSKTYCSVKCENGTTLTKTNGDTHVCKPNPPVCNGVGQLKSGDQIWKRASNMWKTKDGSKTYCSVKCENGTTLTKTNGDTHVCKPNPPVCNGVGQLKSGDQIWKRASNMWKTKDGSKTYCSVKCESGTTLTKTNGDTHVCKPNPPVCNGVGQLKSGDQIWKRASNMWKTKDGSKTYCSVKCESGTTLTKTNGDTHVCKPNPPVCNGVGQLKSGDQIWKRASNMWKTKDGSKTYCSVKCENGTTLTKTNGDTHVCKPNPPVCNGVGQLKSGDQIWKRASNMWKTKDGSKTYCSVKCESGTTLTKTNGDTHVCKPNPLTCQQMSNRYGVSHNKTWGSATAAIKADWKAQSCTTCKSGHVKDATGKCGNPAPVCNGVGQLKSGDQIWKRASNMWKTKDGSKTYCSVKCENGTTLTKTNGDTHVCKPNAPACQGTGLPKVNEKIWKKSANQWTTQFGKKTFCTIKCPQNTKLTHVGGNQHVCKANAPACNGVGQLKSGDQIWKRASNMWKTKDGSKTYCSVKCENGTTLTKTNGDTHVCKPNPLTCQQMSNRYGVSHNKTWGSATAAIKADWKAQSCTTCKSGHVKDATGKCGNPAPVCNGVGQLKSGDQIWKRASNMWKTKDGSKTYCSVKCENGTTLTKTNGDTHVCKPNPPVCNGVGQLKSGDQIWKRASNMWKTKDGSKTYCSVKCENGTTLTKTNGDTHVCKPNQTANATCKGQFKTLPGFVKRIAQEGKTATAQENIWVFYGVKDCYNKKDFKKGARVRCNNNTFGDPFPGKRKECYAFSK